MVNYRRNKVLGGTYFFTVTLKNRSASYLIDYVGLLHESIQFIKNKHSFDVIAFVILNDHLHTIWQLPENDANYPKRWQAIKSRFTRSLVKQGVSLIKNKKGEYNLWQKRYWEHTIRDERDLQNHIDYIHFNPVKHSYVDRVIDWPHSSFHRYVDEGLIDKNWAHEPTDIPGTKFNK